MSEYIISTTNMPEHVRETLNAWCDVSGEIVRCRDCAYVLHREYNSEREKALEKLVRDMAKVILLCKIPSVEVDETACRCMDRMAELGIEVN